LKELQMADRSQERREPLVEDEFETFEDGPATPATPAAGDHTHAAPPSDPDAGGTHDSPRGTEGTEGTGATEAAHAAAATPTAPPPPMPPASSGRHDLTAVFGPFAERVRAAVAVALDDFLAEVPGLKLSDEDERTVLEAMEDLAVAGLRRIGADQSELPAIAVLQADAMHKLRGVAGIKAHDAEVLVARSVHRIFAHAQDAALGGLHHLLAEGLSLLGRVTAGIGHKLHLS
jgi:hypothetical protein